MRHLFSSWIPLADKNMILAPKFLFLGPFATVIRMVWNPHLLWLMSNAEYLGRYPLQTRLLGRVLESHGWIGLEGPF